MKKVIILFYFFAASIVLSFYYTRLIHVSNLVFKITESIL